MDFLHSAVSDGVRLCTCDRAGTAGRLGECRDSFVRRVIDSGVYAWGRAERTAWEKKGGEAV